MQRLQTPIVPALAMSINKAQGQTMKRLGLNLHMPVSLHGQFSLAFSCVGSQDGIVVLALGPHPRDDPDGMYTIIVVFREVLQ